MARLVPSEQVGDGVTSRGNVPGRLALVGESGAVVAFGFLEADVFTIEPGVQIKANVRFVGETVKEGKA